MQDVLVWTANQRLFRHYIAPSERMSRPATELKARAISAAGRWTLLMIVLIKMATDTSNDRNTGPIQTKPAYAATL